MQVAEVVEPMEQGQQVLGAVAEVEQESVGGSSPGTGTNGTAQRGGGGGSGAGPANEGGGAGTAGVAMVVLEL